MFYFTSCRRYPTTNENETNLLGNVRTKYPGEKVRVRKDPNTEVLMTYEEYKQMNKTKEPRNETPSNSPGIPIGENLEKFQNEDDKKKWLEYQANQPLKLSHNEFQQLSQTRPIRNQSDKVQTNQMREVGAYRHQKQQEQKEIIREKKKDIVRHYNKGYDFQIQF